MATATNTVEQRPDDRVSAVRAFNRFYTKRIGLLGDGYLRTRFSLAEARIIYELAQAASHEVVELRRRLELDPGYLSRILARFERRGLVSRSRLAADRRRQVVRLTGRGRAAFRTLDRRSSEELREALAGRSERDQGRLLAAMAAIEAILGEGEREDGAELVIRAPEPGDHGWVIERHGALYAEEHGWGPAFEGLVAAVVAGFASEHDPDREGAWIAELDGERVGSVYCTRRSEEVAQLRLLLVEPWARGRGIGSRLVDDCIEFARAAGYERMMLWTNSSLTSARRIYEAAGFRLTSEEPHGAFDPGTVGQYFWLEL